MTLRWIGYDPLEGFVGMVNPAFDQRAWRFREDDGTETSATWTAAQNTVPSPKPVNEVFRLRFEIQETAGASQNNATIVLQYDINNSNSWVNIDEASPGVRLTESAFVAHGTATTNQLTAGTGTFRPGIVATTASGTDISFAGNDHAEVEWCFHLVGADLNDGDTVRFRVTINGALPATSTAGNASLTVVKEEEPGDVFAVIDIDLVGSIEISVVAEEEGGESSQLPVQRPVFDVDVGSWGRNVPSGNIVTSHSAVIRESISSPDGDNIFESTNATGVYVAKFGIGDLPSDFDSMLTYGWQVRARLWSTGGNKNNTRHLDIRVMSDDGATVLAAWDAAGAWHRIANNPAASAEFQNSPVTAFPYVNTSVGRDVWDNAVVEIAADVTRSGAGDTYQLQIDTLEFSGTYVAGDPAESFELNLSAGVEAVVTPAVSLTISIPVEASIGISASPSVSVALEVGAGSDLSAQSQKLVPQSLAIGSQSAIDVVVAKFAGVEESFETVVGIEVNHSASSDSSAEFVINTAASVDLSVSTGLVATDLTVTAAASVEVAGEPEKQSSVSIEIRTDTSIDVIKHASSEVSFEAQASITKASTSMSDGAASVVIPINASIDIQHTSSRAVATEFVQTTSIVHTAFKQAGVTVSVATSSDTTLDAQPSVSTSIEYGIDSEVFVSGAISVSASTSFESVAFVDVATGKSAEVSAFVDIAGGVQVDPSVGVTVTASLDTLTSIALDPSKHVSSTSQLDQRIGLVVKLLNATQESIFVSISVAHVERCDLSTAYAENIALLPARLENRNIGSALRQQLDILAARR
jgi:hypothetical protein